MTFYRKKPVQVEARQIDANDYDGMLEIAKWSGSIPVDYGGYVMIIPTLGGGIYAEPGDYIVRGIAGEFYPCKPSIFEAIHERIER